MSEPKQCLDALHKTIHSQVHEPTREGEKFDQDKTRFDLLVPEFEEAMAQVMTKGAAKYKPNNWQGVPDFRTRYIAALRRHINAYQQGESIDPESGISHMAHIACNAMFLYWKEEVNETQ